MTEPLQKHTDAYEYGDVLEIKAMSKKYDINIIIVEPEVYDHKNTSFKVIARISPHNNYSNEFSNHDRQVIAICYLRNLPHYEIFIPTIRQIDNTQNFEKRKSCYNKRKTMSTVEDQHSKMADNTYKKRFTLNEQRAGSSTDCLQILDVHNNTFTEHSRQQIKRNIRRSKHNKHLQSFRRKNRKKNNINT
jgi:hypothetical protein